MSAWKQWPPFGDWTLGEGRVENNIRSFPGAAYNVNGRWEAFVDHLSIGSFSTPEAAKAAVDARVAA